MSGIAWRRAVAKGRKGKRGSRAGRGTATGIRQGKSACANHRQAIGMAWCFAHMAVGRAYACAILPAKSKRLRMGGFAGSLGKREGVSRDGDKGVMFDAESDRADDLARQMETDALNFAATLPGVDVNRLGVCGISCSGGHALILAGIGSRSRKQGESPWALTNGK